MDGLNEATDSAQPAKVVQMDTSDSPDANIDRSKQGDQDDNPSVTAERAVVLRARQRFEFEMSVDQENRTNHIEDMRFAWVRGAQWNDQIRRARETAKPPRPWLEFNQTGQFIKQIVNDQRQNQPAIKVRPKGGGAKKQTADLMSGMIRDIEYCSTAPAIYDSDIEQAVTGGRGYHRIVTEWESEDSFNQVLRLRPIPDAMSVLVDSASIQPDKSDIRYGFVLEWFDKDTVEDEWPQTQGTISWDNTAEETAHWFVDGKVCVVDYYEVVEEQMELLALSDGRVMWRDDFDRSEVARKATTVQAPGSMALAMPDMTTVIMRQEMRSRKRVDWYKLSACDTPLAKYQWLGKYVPIIMCPGDEITIAGKKIYQGIIRRIRDAQMMYNYWFTLATEKIALAPKAPYTALSGQLENHPEWQKANIENYSVLEYDPVQIGDQWYVTPPGRTAPIEIDQGLVTMLQLCAQNLREITGMKEAALGQTTQPDKPWRAILAEQKKGDTATFHYADNLSRAIALTGRILVDLIPKIYDKQRIVNMLNEDGTQKPVTVNAAMPNGVENDLSVGEFDVVCDAGPSFATRRVEAAAEMKEFMATLGPEQATAMGAIIAKSVDWPGDTGDKISALLTCMLPQPQQQIINGDASQDPMVASLQAAMKQQQQQFQQVAAAAAQHIQQLTQEMTDLKLQITNKTMEFTSKLITEQTKRTNMEQDRAMMSENNAQQEFVDKLDNMQKFMTAFIAAAQAGMDPTHLAQVALQTVEGASSALRSGPDFSDSMNLLMQTAQQGNEAVGNIVNATLPNGVPNPLAPMAPQGNAGGAGGAMPPPGAIPPPTPPPAPAGAPSQPPNGAPQ